MIIRIHFCKAVWLSSDCFFLSDTVPGVDVVVDVIYRGCTDLTVEDTGLQAVKPVISDVILREPLLNGLRVNYIYGETPYADNG